jgi:hypothetical protein
MKAAEDGWKVEKECAVRARASGTNRESDDAIAVFGNIISDRKWPGACALLVFSTADALPWFRS